MVINGSVIGGVVVVSLIGVSGLAGAAMFTPPDPELLICSSQKLGSWFPGSSADLGPSLVFFSNLWVTFTYAMVGWYLGDTQIRRYVATRSWSLSGLALTGVFPSCAAMHLIMALTNGQATSTLWADLIGVPASVYFLWVVKQLHADSAIDWNRRPIAGLAAAPNRSSPWSEAVNTER